MTRIEALKEILGTQTKENINDHVWLYRESWKDRNPNRSVRLDKVPRDQILPKDGRMRFWLALVPHIDENAQKSLASGSLRLYREQNGCYGDIDHIRVERISHEIADDWGYTRFPKDALVPAFE